MIQTGTKLGRYQIRSKIGAGGMGEVYRARDMELGRDVAVKVLPSSFAVDATRLQRFQQEACSAGALNHPNVLIVHDIGACEGAPYIVSELLEGETLRKRIGGRRWANVARSTTRCRSRTDLRLRMRKESFTAI
jgi:serine/threonine protein kinase